MNEAKAAAALKTIGNGFLALAAAISEEAEESSAHVAMKEQAEVNAARDGKVATVKKIMTIVKKSSAKPAPEPEPADKEDHTPTDADEALEELASLDLASAGRPKLKELAEALGFDVTGKKGSDIRDMLAQKKTGGKTKVAVPAVKGKGLLGKVKSKAKDDEPDAETKQAELIIFFKANSEALGDDFFRDVDEDEEYDEKNPCVALILADPDLTAEYWKDNVVDAKSGGEWDAMVEAAEAVVE